MCLIAGKPPDRGSAGERPDEGLRAKKICLKIAAKTKKA
jgi:hypothetical protein